MKRDAGFTLIELMITLVIVGILAGIGVPALKTFIQGNTLIASTNELVSALNIARSEAIKLDSRVSICESSNGSTCTTTGKWQNGWIVFVDADGNLANNGKACTAVNTDCLLRVHAGLIDNSLSVTGIDTNSGSISAVTFTSRGSPKDASGAGVSGTFSICSFDSSNKVIGSRAVVLSVVGRVRVSDNSAVVTCPVSP